MTRIQMSLAGMALALSLVACGSATEQNQNATTSPQAQVTPTGTSGCGQPADCPLRAEGVTRTVVDTPTGVAVDFVTQTAGAVEPLRAKVRMMADGTCVAGKGAGMRCGSKADCPPEGKGCDRMAGAPGGRHGAGMGSGGGMAGCPMGEGKGQGSASCDRMGKGAGSCDRMASGGMRCGSLPAAGKAMAEIAGGARLTFTPAAAGGLDALRGAVRTHFETAQKGCCAGMK